MIQLEWLEHLRSKDTPGASWLPILLSHIGSYVKKDKVKVRNLKNSPKCQMFEFWKKNILQATHLLEFLDKICKYEMDPMSAD